MIKAMKKFGSLFLVFSLIISLFGGYKIGASTNQTNKFEYENYTVQYSIRNNWDKNYEIDIKIINTGAEPIYNWALGFKTQGDIKSIWSAEIYSQEDDEIIIKNKGYNSVIEAGSTVDFGYRLLSDEYISPDVFELCTSVLDKTEDVEFQFNIINEWESGFQGEFLIKNNSSYLIDAWKLSIDTNFTIEDTWDAKIKPSSESSYELTCESWNSILEPDSVKSIRFNARKNTESQSTVGKFKLEQFAIGIKENNKYDITLSSNITEVFVSPNKKIIYLYAKTESNFDNLYVTDELNGISAKMVDDGLYSISGDDLADDGIYSCKIELDISEEKKYNFCVITTDFKSNTIEIIVYDHFTDKELEDMYVVDNCIKDIMTLGFYDLSIEERKTLVEKLLYELSDNGTSENPYSLLDRDSIYYDKNNKIFSFTYKCGVLGGIKLEKYSAGIRKNSGGRDEQVKGTEKEAATILPKSENVNTNKFKLTALILDGFISFDDNRYDKYNDLKDTWNSKGLETVHKSANTIEEFRGNNLKGYDLIVFSMHGEYYTYRYGFLNLKSSTQPVLHITEEATKEKDKKYTLDLKEHRLGKFNGTYCILPSFFEYNYSDNELEGTIIFMENCNGFGQWIEYDEQLAKSLISSGADTVVGFLDSVYEDYSFFMLNTFVDSLINDSTTGEAFHKAVSQYGEDDVIWANDYYTPEELAFEQDKSPSTPHILGDMDKMLLPIGVENGSFEKDLSSWNSIGDSRVITRLGEFSPLNGKNMVLITTGIGSAESVYLQGKEGSAISQSFKVPFDADKLVFTYNVISEEPMEYVGSSYDDKFYVKLYNKVGFELDELAYESINTSTWHRTYTINFEGGDNTAYHTKWITVEYDISKFAGNIVTLKFIVFDVGDSQYDTAALIDDVKIITK